MKQVPRLLLLFLAEREGMKITARNFRVWSATLSHFHPSLLMIFHLKPTDSYKVREREVEERGSEREPTENKKTKKKRKQSAEKD